MFKLRAVLAGQHARMGSKIATEWKPPSDLRDAGFGVALGGVRAQPMHAFRKAGWIERSDIAILDSFDEALDRAIG